MVYREMRRHYPGADVRSVDTVHAVAKGAAIYAARERSGVKVTNVL